MTQDLVAHEMREAEITSYERASASLRRYWRRGFATFIVLYAAVVGGLALCPRKYTSEALLFVRLGRESVTVDPTAATGTVMHVQDTRSQEIASVVEIASSRNVRERIVDRLGPDFILKNPQAESLAKQQGEARLASIMPDVDWLSVLGLRDPIEPREKAVIELGYQLEARVRNKTNVVAVNAEAKTPEQAQAILQTALEEFLEDHLHAYHTSGSEKFFVDQTGRIGKELRAKSELLRDLKNKLNVVSPEQRAIAIEDELKATRLAMFESEADLSGAAKGVESLDASSGKLPSEIVIERKEGLPNEAADDMRVQLFNLQAQEQALLTSRTEEHPQVKSIRLQMAQMKTILGRESSPRDNRTLGLNPTRQPLELAAHQQRAERDALGGKFEQSREHYDQLLAETTNLNQHWVDLTELEREVALLDASYRSYAQKLEETRIDRALDAGRISNVNVIQPPTLQHKPSSPNKPVVLVLGFAASAAGALSCIYLSSRRTKAAPPSLPVEPSERVAERAATKAAARSSKPK